MADQDFKINVVTTADTTGIRKTSDELEKLKRQQAMFAETARRESIAHEADRARAAKERPPPVPDQFKDFDPLLFTRAIQGFAVVITTILNGLRRGISEQSALNKELEKSTEHVSRLTESWNQQALAATSQDDIARIVQRAIPAIDDLTTKITGANKAMLSFSQGGFQGVTKLVQVINNLTGAIGSGFSQLADPAMFSKSIQQVNDYYATLKQHQIDAAADAIEFGRGLEKAFDANNVRPVQDVIDETTRSIAYMKGEMLNLNVRTEDGLKLWEQYRQQVKGAEIVLADAQKRQTDQQKDLGKAQDNASIGVKGVLMNEEAARKARQEGHDKDAELYQKSAERIEKGLLPAQQQELENIRRKRKELEPTPTGRRAGIGESQDLVDQIEKNKKAYDDYWKTRPAPDPSIAGGGKIGPEAQKEREEAILETLKESQAAMKDRLDSLLVLTREQMGIWR